MKDDSFLLNKGNWQMGLFLWDKWTGISCLFGQFMVMALFSWLLVALAYIVDGIGCLVPND